MAKRLFDDLGIRFREIPLDGDPELRWRIAATAGNWPTVPMIFVGDHFVGGYTHGLANFSVPYMNAIDVKAGYAVIDNLTTDVGLSWVARKVALQGQESEADRGELSDSQIVFKLGVGFQM